MSGTAKGNFGGGRGRPGRIWSIRWIVTTAAVGLTTVATVSVGSIAERNARRALTAEMETRLVLEARNLALTSAGALLTDYPELTLQPLVREKMAKQKELAFAVVVDAAGIIQGHPDARHLGTPYTAPVGLAPLPGLADMSPGESLQQSESNLVASAPILHGSGKQLGTALVAMRRAYVEGAIVAARRQQTLALGAFVVIGILVSFVIMSQLLKPIVALRAGLERIAGGDLDTRLRVRDRTELGLLAGAINDMAAGLKRAQAQMVERERLAHEVGLARQIQRSILPSGRVVAGPFIIEGSQRAAAEVGGDYYDYFPFADGTVGIAVADVSGKGLAGCLVMSMLSALLRALRHSIRSPAELLAVLDERLAETLQQGSFVTMFYGVLDPASGRLTYASAGHNPLLIYRRATGQVERLRTRGVPLCAIRGGAVRASLEDHVAQLDPGDVFLQFTDGINEAFDPTGHEQFGYERMTRILSERAPLGSAAVIEGMLNGVVEWTDGGVPLDDETVLVISRDGATPDVASSGEDRSGEPFRDALDRLAEARRRGRHLRLPARLDALDGIRGWLEESPLLAALPRADAELLVTTLYEVCSNIVEHGYQHDESKELELWWVPPEGGSVNGAPFLGEGTPVAEAAVKSVRRGYFLIRDHGTAFSANEWKGQDLSDPRVRRRGRGLGLEIIHRVMRPVKYNPSSLEGNLTIMSFEGIGRRTQNRTEVHHAG